MQISKLSQPESLSSWQSSKNGEVIRTFLYFNLTTKYEIYIEAVKWERFLKIDILVRTQ